MLLRNFITKNMFVILIIIMCIAFSYLGFLGTVRHQAVAWKSYRVADGDTLWTVAIKSNVHHSDLRDVVDMIQTKNHMNTEVRPGDLILYPVSKE